ncbi:hypothetical protein AAMO2058_001181500 [Amorphochlora amoebiformis]|uniref:NADH dehydrogenase [ubiquinone] 1 alpha subcomplex assembly factor 3 n=1 Tax=Amorphochlora amoebiformis TaxID=1561963 RepID=A0A7S0GSN8_9EUKA|mmetsp:Transcript_13939/g.22057  ORF Transcript_13939/g.22057 Transcript_13939/m.22057 type:complete len:179 (+) Transcript_13939:13-549(+)
MAVRALRSFGRSSGRVFFGIQRIRNPPRWGGLRGLKCMADTSEQGSYVTHSQPTTYSLGEWMTQIQSFSDIYFVVNGYRMGGSIVALPNLVAQWKPQTLDEITPSCLSFLELISPETECVVIGTGKGSTKLPLTIERWFRDKKMTFEALPTSSAVSTFNLLCGENRRVAAILLPAGSS